MRVRLIVTVAAAVSMVLLAMLVPMALLLRSLALEDRLARAALEVQATESVVATDDRGDIAVYVANVNEQDPALRTTVLYAGDEPDIGPTPGEDERVQQARLTGIARVDDVDDGAEILVPVSLGPSSGPPAQTPVIRVEVAQPSLGSGIYRIWLILAALGLLLLAGALVLADRLGRGFVGPIERLSAFARHLGQGRTPAPVEVTGPGEVRQLGQSINQLVERVQELLARERASVSDLSHRLRTPVTALRLRVDAMPPSADRDRLSADLDELQAMVDQIVREARRSEREGLVAVADAAEVLADRARFWQPLAEDQGRSFDLHNGCEGPVLVRASKEDLVALLDVLMDNVFTHTPESAGLMVRLHPRSEGGLTLIVEDEGPGIPEASRARGSSSGGSTGLGLSIADKTATASGGGMHLEQVPGQGARVVVELGPPV